MAREFRDEGRFYFPHNLDFRGRAYPIHPHLNHMGQDVCRGILTFADARPLGPDGLGWLYVMVSLSLHPHSISASFFGAGQKSQIRKRCSSWTRLTLCVTGLDKTEHAQCVVDSAESGLACMPGIHMPALCFKVLASNVNHVKGDILWSAVVSAAVQACMGVGPRHNNRCWRGQIFIYNI